MTAQTVSTASSRASKRAVDKVRPWRVFDRPVFVLSAPRSGSTLLQEMLAVHPALRSWPREAHIAFGNAENAQHPDRHWAQGHRWPVSYATEGMRLDLTRELYLGRIAARRATGLPVGRTESWALRKVRFLDKTPANVLRVGAIARLFPDARLVFLHRDAPASMGSLIEAWETPSGAHAKIEVDGRVVDWMMLAPPGWLDLTEAPIAVRTAFQWREAMQYALDDLEQVPAERVLRLAYEDLVVDPEPFLRRILDHCQLSADPGVLASASKIGQRGRTSLSAPAPDKWRQRAAEIEPLLPDLAAVRRRLGYPA